jgi:hypothetical protein
MVSVVQAGPTASEPNCRAGSPGNSPTLFRDFVFRPGSKLFCRRQDLKCLHLTQSECFALRQAAALRKRLTFSLSTFADEVPRIVRCLVPMADSTLRLPDSYLLLQSGGNASPSAQDIKTVLSAVGCAHRSVYGAAN